MSNVRKLNISNCEKKFLKKLLLEHTRLDGRTVDEFRTVDIKFNKHWGCCYVSLGKTRVLAQVSCEVQVPKSSRPSEGILNINLELNPLAAPHFEAGRQSDLSVQLNRLLEKCLKDSKAIDLESLCIKMNEKVWALRVDINVLNHEGNILDCASIAGLAALAHFRRPDATCDGEEFIIHSYKQRDPIPIVIHHYPVCVTYSIFSEGNFIIADPSLLEESITDAFLSICLNAYNELCGLQLGGKASLNSDTILSIVHKAAARTSTVIQLIKDAVNEDVLKRQEGLEQGFDKTINTEHIEIPLDNFKGYLDQWKATGKKKKKSKFSEKAKPDVGHVREKGEFTAEIEPLGEGSAALVPNEIKEDGQVKVWDLSESEHDDDDVLIIETPKPVVYITGSDSEEEAVVVLNADKKTNKKKKLKS